MAESVTALRKKVAYWESEFAKLPPALMADTLTERETNARRYIEVKESLSAAKAELEQALQFQSILQKSSAEMAVETEEIEENTEEQVAEDTESAEMN